MFASLPSAKRSTTELVKEWVTVEDGRVRDFGEGDGIVDDFSHRSMNEVTVPLDQPFKVPMRTGATEELMYPGDPSGSAANVINCRCAQVYVPADDDDVEDLTEARPFVPVAGDARARLLDRLRGEQPVFSANADGAFDNSLEDMLKAIATVGDLNPMIRDKGAYANFTKQISMGNMQPGSVAYQRVFRHEYGHILDDMIAKKVKTGSARSRRFASWSHVGKLAKDGKELEAVKSKTFMGDKAAATTRAAENSVKLADRMTELSADASANGLDGAGIIRKYLTDVEPEDVFRLYDVDNMEVTDASLLVASWERRDVGYAIAELPHRLNGNRAVTHNSAFAGMQDTFEASTAGNVRIAFGHGKRYYTQNNRWTSVEGLAGTFGRRKYNAYATGQAFANWWEARGDPNPAAYALYKRLYPRTAEGFEGMVREFVDDI